MATITVKGHIHYKKEDWECSESSPYKFFNWHDLESQGYVYVCPHEMTFTIPHGWNPVPGQLAALEKERERVTAEFQKMIARINEQVNKLQAIEYTPCDTAEQR